jgi:hypothetical protein
LASSEVLLFRCRLGRQCIDAALAEKAFVAADPALLAEALCVEEERVVARDNTINYGRRTLQLPASPARPHYVKARVTLCQGQLAIQNRRRPRQAEETVPSVRVTRPTAQTLPLIGGTTAGPRWQLSNKITTIAGVHVRGRSTYFAAREAGFGPSRKRGPLSGVDLPMTWLAEQPWSRAVVAARLGSLI